MIQTAVQICKQLTFACKMYTLFPNSRTKYRADATKCVTQLEEMSDKDSAIFEAWKIGQIALDQMK